MRRSRVAALIVSLAAIGGLFALVITTSTPPASRDATSGKTTGLWTKQHATGHVQLAGEVPLKVVGGKSPYLEPAPASTKMSLNFGLPLRNAKALDNLIAVEGRTHNYLTRSELYARFSPPSAQITALEGWLTSNGLQVTHVGLDRLAVTATGTTGQVERALHVQINDYVSPAFTFDGVKVKPYVFYSNTTDPTLPARLGLQTVSGLSNVDRFFTDVQISEANHKGAQTTGTRGEIPAGADCGDDGDGDGNPVSPLCVDTRSGGYFPLDIRSMYDVAGHGYDGTGQTLGFTLWGAGETQPAMTAFASQTGDQLITVLPPCVATSNTPTHASSCATQHVGADQLMTILENGNTNNNYAGNVETGLDIEQAHGIATHAGMKYYDADCSTGLPPGSGLTNASCNGSDVGLEDAVEDAANDPTLHSVSDSWAYGGEAEFGATDPFTVATENSFQIAAAAGTTFYFSTGDTGTYQSGFPSDSPYVVGVGGTTLFSTTSSTAGNPTAAALSTEDTWAAGGSWCSNIWARPSWQTGPGVTANASCPGRAIPDISAVADTNSAVKFVSSTNGSGGIESGSVGGTSVAAPELNGLEAVTENFIAGQTYAGPTPPIGFEAPVMYQLGNSSNSSSYFRDILCGNTASPASAPDGDAAQPGWDQATGWGALDWFNYATGYAMALGATNLSAPSSLSPNYSWNCAKTPSNSSERGLSFPSASVGYAVGAASGGTPWPAKFLPSGSWGAVNTFFQTTNGGTSWVPSNSDMLAIACTSSTSCVEVGDGGVIKTTGDGGVTWSAVASPTNKALTQVTCPSSTVCYAAGDRGIVIKSGDGGQTWSYVGATSTATLGSAGGNPDGNPIYGLTCPSTTTCYTTDVYAHILKTTDGGNTWTWQQTPVTTPGVDVPGSGGPNPFAGLFGASCVDANDCVAVGGFPPTGTDPPIVVTKNGGTSWALDTSNAGTNDYLNGVSCIATTQTCFAVGRAGAIVETTNLEGSPATWTKLVSNTTNSLSGIECQSTTSCIATGQNGTIDVLTGTTWTATTGNGGGVYLAGIACPGGTTCFAAGKQGVTLGTTNLTSWTQQAGGGTTQQMNAVACPSTGTCFAVGNAGTILATTNSGQTWLPETSNTTSALNGVSCAGPTTCTAVGAAGTVRFTTDGSTWQTGTSGTTNALNGVSCTSATACTAVGAAGTILGTANDGSTWAPQTSGVSVALSAVACPSLTCYAAGAVTGGSAVILKTNDGSTWTPQASGSGQALSGISCLDASNCFAGGAIGTIVATTDGGATWTQRGNPISGPTTALNAGPASITAINAAACSPQSCFMGTASSGDIMTTPLLYVTVKTTSVYGMDPSLELTGLSPASSTLSYSPSSEAANVTGSLTCTTTATSTSDVGTYPVSACDGLADNGFSVVYDYVDSSLKVLPVATSTTITSSVTLAGLGQQVTYTATVTPVTAAPAPSTGSVSFLDGTSPVASCTNVTISAGVATCTTSYASAGNHSIQAVYNPGPDYLGSTSPSLGEVATNCKSSKGCNLQGANLTNANLSGMDLQGSNLQNATLTGANLSGANLQGVNMQNDNAAGANFAGDNLQGDNLQNMKLAGANFQGANLQGDNLQNDDLTNANLAQANLSGANVQGANLTGATLLQAVTKGANLGKITWSNTTCPDGTNSNNDKGTCQNNL